MPTIVPGVLYIGDYHGNGGRTNAIVGSTGYPNYSLQYTLDPDLTKPLPANADGSPDYTSTFRPWYDGSAGDDYQIVSVTATSMVLTGGPAMTVNAQVGRKIALYNYPYPSGFGKPPAEAVITANGTNSVTVAAWPLATIVTAGSFVIDQWYQIVTVGTTDFTLIGASANTVGVVFQATGAGTGTGTAKILPTPGQFVRVGRGKFIHYSPINGGTGTSLVSGLSDGRGSSWQAGGDFGVGSDMEWVKGFAEKVWPDAPRYHALKFLSAGALGVDWIAGGLGRIALLAELARVSAAALELDHIIRWDLVIVNVSGEDIRTAYTAPTNYTTNLAELFNWLSDSTVLNNTSWFEAGDHHRILVNHSINLWNDASEAPGASFIVRQVHEAFARRPENKCAVYDMEGQNFAQKWTGAPTVFFPLTPVTNDPRGDSYYTFEAYRNEGRGLPDVYLRQINPPPTVTGSGIAVYGILGDSIAVGQVAPQWVTFLASQSLIGTAPGTTVDFGYVYNRANPSLDPYNPVSNANTSGTESSNCGPELQIIAWLATLHGANNFVVVKRAANSSTLQEEIGTYTGDAFGRWIKTDVAATVADEHFDEFVADVAGALELCRTQLGRYPEWHGLFIPSVGQNDCTVEGGGTRAAALLSQFVIDLRTTIGTSVRPSGQAWPIVWCLPINGLLGFNETEVNILRAALVSLAGNDPKLELVEMNGVERDRVDHIHDPPLIAVLRGTRMFDKLQTIRLT